MSAFPQLSSRYPAFATFYTPDGIAMKPFHYFTCTKIAAPLPAQKAYLTMVRAPTYTVSFGQEGYVSAEGAHWGGLASEHPGYSTITQAVARIKSALPDEGIYVGGLTGGERDVQAYTLLAEEILRQTVKRQGATQPPVASAGFLSSPNLQATVGSLFSSLFGNQPEGVFLAQTWDSPTLISHFEQVHSLSLANSPVVWSFLEALCSKEIRQHFPHCTRGAYYLLCAILHHAPRLSSEHDTATDVHGTAAALWDTHASLREGGHPEAWAVLATHCRHKVAPIPLPLC